MLYAKQTLKGEDPNRNKRKKQPLKGKVCILLDPSLIPFKGNGKENIRKAEGYKAIFEYKTNPYRESK